MNRVLVWFGVSVLTVALATSSQAAPVFWSVNGHYYDLVLDSGAPTWYEAKDSAAAMTYASLSGYLATVTTKAEQDFLIASFGGGEAIDSVWVGGYQDTLDPDYYETDGGWKWITGEPWITGPDAPVFSFNNTYFDLSSEEYLITWWGTGGLNDIRDIYGARGYFVEYEGQPITVPVPASCLLAGCGALATVLRRRARHV